jgi:transcriptional regulator with XRE-family HTH domain
LTDTTSGNAISRPARIRRLAKSLGKPGFRHAYMARQLKLFLAQQIRALRGDLSQSEFGMRVRKPQSVISRLEKQADKQISIQTLIDIAASLDIAVLIRFVDFPTFLRVTEDFSDAAIAPPSYGQAAINQLVAEQSSVRAPGIPTPEQPAIDKPAIPTPDDLPASSPPQIRRQPLQVVVLPPAGQAQRAAFLFCPSPSPSHPPPPSPMANWVQERKPDPQKPTIEAPPRWAEKQTSNPLRATA